MPASLKEIEEQARNLSAEDRAKLAEAMLESLQSSLSEIDATWAEEIERRIAAFDRHEISSYPAASKRTLEIEKTPGAKELLATLRKFRGRLPKGFKFDRLEANVHE